MPRGQLTPFPADYVPLKTSYGWTVLKLRIDADGVLGVDAPRARDGKHMEFWRRRKDAAEHITGVVVFAENEQLRREVEELRKALRLSVSDRSVQQFASVS